MVDLSDVAVVDNHCHAVDADQQLPDVASWRARFTESPDPSTRARDAGDTAFYRRLLRRLAAFHGVAEDESAVLERRATLSTVELTAALVRDADIAGMVVDTGHPPAAQALSGQDLRTATGVPQGDLLRLELLFQDLVAEHATLDDTLSALRVALADLRGQGLVGLKSIVGYRTGLDVRRWDGADQVAAFRSARAEVGATGAVRLGHQPLLDTMLHVALLAAAEQQAPVQFHVGYGDPDVDLRTASPLGLRAVLEEPAYRGAPVVLLHGCWPYVREGAFLASVYGNAFLDLSYGIPFLSLGELTAMTRAALGVAPFSKLMYSSDGSGVPELHWMGAHDGRRVLGRVLDELVADGDLDAGQARGAGERILAANAWELYGFAGLRP